MSARDFVFPWQHQFPPFFTLQPHRETRVKQLEAWRSLVLDYCQKQGLTSFEVTEIASSPLFHNKEIRRRLSPEALAAVLEDLRVHGHLEWTDKARKQRCHVYWRTPEEWGGLIFAWAQENGMSNTVCTVYELAHGEDSTGQPFHGLEQELLIKALKTLELNKKAEVFPDGEGVKFF